MNYIYITIGEHNILLFDIHILQSLLSVRHSAPWLPVLLGDIYIYVSSSYVWCLKFYTIYPFFQSV